MEVERESMDSIEGDDDTQLIRGLPDDITLFCLARVPRRYHTVLKCVSRRWRDLVCGEDWHEYRRKNNLAETWIYALCRGKNDLLSLYFLNPHTLRRCWKPITGIPVHCLKRKGMGFEAFGKKIYLMGGCGWSEDTTNEVHCYDVPRNSWTEVTSLPTARCYFACEVVNGKICAIGGLGSNPSGLVSWDCFDPSTNTSESRPTSTTAILSEIVNSAVLDGKIYIRCTDNALTLDSYVMVYDPASDTWQHADEDFVSGWKGPAVVVEGKLYVLDESSGTKLMRWDTETGGWVSVGRLSSLLTRPPCQLAAIGKKIFIVGKGLSTVVVNIGETGMFIERVVVSSSIPPLNDHTNDVIVCCTSVAV
ncbi:F-box/kelch-repeat protein SKIP4 [Linum perenne]